jgi:hypothetical protein
VIQKKQVKHHFVMFVQILMYHNQYWEHQYQSMIIMIMMKNMSNKLMKWSMIFGECTMIKVLGMKKPRVKMDLILLIQKAFQNGAKFFD